MTGEVVGIVVVGILSLIGTAFAAVQSRRTNTATVDIRLFKVMQEDVLQLRTELSGLRRELFESQDETDRERKRRRRAELRIESMSDAVERIIRMMVAAELPVPPDLLSWMRDPKAKEEEP